MPLSISPAFRHTHKGIMTEDFRERGNISLSEYIRASREYLEITSTYKAYIDENTSIGTVIYTATAEDPKGSSSEISFDVTGADASNFSINGNGELSMTISPDYEEKAFYAIDIIASKANYNSAVKRVVVFVNNLDETAPVFQVGDHFTEPFLLVASTCPIGTVLFTVEAIDSGDLSNGNVTYSISSQYNSAFAINSTTGEVTLAAQPGNGGWGTSNSPNIATITAQDDVGNSVSQNVEIRGTVGPTLGTSVSAISESKEAIGVDGLVEAADIIHTISLSNYTRSELDFEIVTDTSGKFGIVADGSDTLGGGLYLLNGQSLDFDTDTSHDVIVRAVSKDLATSEPGIISSSTTLTIPVTDVQPVITSGAVVSSIDENSGANQTIYTATATDADPQSGTLTFSLESGSDSAISIDSSTGAVTLADDPDYETQTSYTFTVVVTNSQGDSASQLLTLNINNLMDIPPSPINSTVTGNSIAEGVYTGASPSSGIYTLSDNLSNTNNASITYTVLSATPSVGSPGFQVNGLGVLEAQSTLDYETAQSHSVVIQTNYTLPTGTTGTYTYTITVPVTNINDTAPVMIGGSTVTISAIDENSGANQVVYTAGSTDADGLGTWNSANQFALGGADASSFSISSALDATYGQVTLLDNPDYENKSSYTFTITSTDDNGNGNTSAPQTVTLPINNVADVAPTWSTVAHAVTTSESTSVNSVLLDLDQLIVNDDNVNLTFSFVSGNQNGHFGIDGNNDLKLLTALDFETTTQHVALIRMSYTLADGTSGGTNIQIAVNVTNAGLTFGTYTTTPTINENTGSGLAVWFPQPTVLDPQYDSSDITYSFAGTDASHFSSNIVPAITLNDNPDFETKSSYSLTVTGTLPSGDSVSQAITLTVVNVVEDPIFTSATSGEVYSDLEGSPAATTEIYAPSVILDSTASSVTYSIGGTDASYLELYDNNTKVRVDATQLPSGNLSHSIKSSYVFTITATDNLGNSTTTGNLTATVIDNLFGTTSMYGMYRVSDINEVDVNASHLDPSNSTPRTYGLLGYARTLQYQSGYIAIGGAVSAGGSTQSVTVSANSDFNAIKYSTNQIMLQTRTSDPVNDPYYTEGEVYTAELVFYDIDDTFFYPTGFSTSSRGFFLDPDNSNFYVTASGQSNEPRVVLNNDSNVSARNTVRIYHSTDTTNISAMNTEAPTGTEIVINEGSYTSGWGSEADTSFSARVSQPQIGIHAFIINHGDGSMSFARTLSDANSDVRMEIDEHIDSYQNNNYTRFCKVYHKQPHHVTAIDQGIAIEATAGLSATDPVGYINDGTTIHDFFGLNTGTIPCYHQFLTSTGFSPLSLISSYNVTSSNFIFNGQIKFGTMTSNSGGTLIMAFMTKTGLATPVTNFYLEPATNIQLTSPSSVNYTSNMAASSVQYTLTGAGGIYGTEPPLTLISATGFSGGSPTLDTSTGEVTFPAGTYDDGQLEVRLGPSGGVNTITTTINLYAVDLLSLDDTFGSVPMRLSSDHTTNYHIIDIPYSDTFTPGDLYHLIISGTADNSTNYRNDLAIGWAQIFNSSGTLVESFSPQQVNWNTSKGSGGYFTSTTVSDALTLSNRGIGYGRTNNPSSLGSYPDGTDGANFTGWQQHGNGPYALNAGTASNDTGPSRGIEDSAYATSSLGNAGDTAIAQNGTGFVYMESSGMTVGEAHFLSTISSFEPPSNGTIKLAVHYMSSAGTVDANNVLRVAFASAP